VLHAENLFQISACKGIQKELIEARRRITSVGSEVGSKVAQVAIGGVGGAPE
jgi:hypothetical protein